MCEASVRHVPQSSLRQGPVHLRTGGVLLVALKDLEQLQHDIVDPKTKTLVAEVVKTYEVGALRSATVSLWIAVVADLTQKMRHLGESGNGRARQKVKELDTAMETNNVKASQDYERTLLKVVTEELEILGIREQKELARLQDDRHLCAHPAYVEESDLFVPDAEMVRAHLVAACRSVFSQRPIAGKRLRDKLGDEIKGDAWPGTDEYFLDRFFRNAQGSVQDNILKLLFKGSIRPLEGSNVWARRCREAAYAAEPEAPGRFERSLKSVLHAWEQDSASLEDSQLIRATGAFGKFPALWRVFPGTARQRWEKLVGSPDIDFLIEERFFISSLPADDEAVTLFEAVVEKMDARQLRAALKQTREREPFVPRIIELVRESGSFRSAESNLRLLQRCSNNLTAADVAELHVAIEENPYHQVRLAGAAEGILISIHEDSPTSDEHNENWRELAAWLNETGTEKGDETYLYGDLCEVVGIGV